MSGAVLGGRLTDNLTWRWVFYINLPIGILAFLGTSAFLSETRDAERFKLDLVGFVTLALAIGALQMMLDRGQQKDWLSSLEICLQAAASSVFLYLFVVPLLITTSTYPHFD